MTSTPTQDSPDVDHGVEIPQTKRPEGQWALGQVDPMNHNEEFKKEDNALNVRARIEEKYSKEGFESISADDLRGRFRWMGLYTQRKPGIDGGRTASLAPEELDDSAFMMRIRVDGGVLDVNQLEAIGEVATRYAQDTADVTDRQNIQLHHVRIEDVPAIWERIEAVDLWTQEACGDCPRVVLGSPLAGLSTTEVLDATPAVEQIKAILREDVSLANLPRKFKTAVSGSWDCVPEINDVSFVGVTHPEHGPGFDVLVGGGLSTSPHLALRVGVWVPLEEVAEVWHGVVKVFRDYGYRRLRNKARLKYLLMDWGAEKFREVLEEVIGRSLLDGPAAPAPTDVLDYIGVTPLNDGTVAVGAAPIAGRVSGTILTGLAQAVRAVGAEKVAFTPLQKIVVLGVDPARADDLAASLDELGLSVGASIWRRGTMACTGLEFCKLAIVDTKERARTLVGDLEARLADVPLERPLAINLNGCPNSCARIQVADIGLKGMIVTDDDGNQVEGFQVHLGGTLGNDPQYGRKLRGHKITSAELGDYVERVVRAYAAERSEDETFSHWALRADEAALL